MNKKFKIRSSNTKTTVDSVASEFSRLGKGNDPKRVVIGAGIGLAVLTCSLNWEILKDSVIFTIKGSHGISGIGIVFVLLSIFFGFFLPFFFGGILILLIIYYLEVMQIKQKISEEIDNIKFKLE
jgi:hypothetical protein